ncbi:hypothetical protein MBLNU459_g0153t1 [Dothideomycetes sp. NU459]
MGQATSSPSSARRSSTPALRQSATATHGQNSRRSSLWRRSLAPFSEPQYSSSSSNSSSAEHSGRNIISNNNHTEADRRRPSRRARSSSIDRLSRFLHSSLGDAAAETPTPDGREEHSQSRRPSRLERARSSLTLPGLFNRRDRSSRSHSPASRLDTTNFDQALRHALDFNLPDVSVPDLDLNFDDLTTTVSAGRPSTPRPTSRRSSLRLPSISNFRGERGARGLASRRRRSPPAGAGEDNTALLSRLLSVAAAATAATLLEGNQQAIADARSVAGDGDDGTFNSFLQSLESGRLASALRQAGQIPDENGGTPGPGQAPLNFFRMFRFGSATGPRSTQTSSSSPDEANNPASSAANAEGESDGRMVPIIIVGIRSVNPSAANTNTNATGMPPFLDALSALPTAPFGTDPTGHDSIDNILRPAQNGTRFSHRRRASMGGVNSTFPSGYDAQRHHRSPDRLRPHSMAANAEAATGQRPPPVTPASPSLSRVTSTNSVPVRTPTQPRPVSTRSNSGGYPATRDSIIRTTTTTTLETTTEDAPLRPRAPRQRRLSESDYTRGAYASRRNGIVEPDNVPTENTRSWIIYVLGGSYPENHPILTTPSLFTDSPTYEDMMLLSALLGPAKPPVASEQDVANAPGIFRIESVTVNELGGTLVAAAIDGTERIAIAPEQRCLVCLCDFEPEEQARRLIKCSHLFHKVCIDEWLTKGRNSCPLCRGQGVDEKEKPSGSPEQPGAGPVSSDNPLPANPASAEPAAVARAA